MKIVKKNLNLSIKSFYILKYTMFFQINYPYFL